MDIADIIEDVRAAKVGSRELDRKIFDVVFGGHIIWDGPELLCVGEEPMKVRQVRYEVPRYTTSMKVRQVRYEVPRYTTSIDAITALIAEKLPGWEWLVRTQIDEPINGLGYVRAPGKRLRDYVGEAADPRLALVLAFLLALQPEQSK